MSALAVEPYEPVCMHVYADEKPDYVAAGWRCIGTSTLPDGPTVYWLEPANTADTGSGMAS